MVFLFATRSADEVLSHFLNVVHAGLSLNQELPPTSGTGQYRASRILPFCLSAIFTSDESEKRIWQAEVGRTLMAED